MDKRKRKKGKNEKNETFLITLFKKSWVLIKGTHPTYKNKKMSDSILSDIPREGELLEEKDEEEKETRTEATAEEKTKSEKPPQEGEDTLDEKQVPFHKHPRFQEITRENKELKEAINELSEFRKDAESKLKGLGE